MSINLLSLKSICYKMKPTFDLTSNLSELIQFVEYNMNILFSLVDFNEVEKHKYWNENQKIKFQNFLKKNNNILLVKREKREIRWLIRFILDLYSSFNIYFYNNSTIVQIKKLICNLNLKFVF